MKKLILIVGLCWGVAFGASKPNYVTYENRQYGYESTDGEVLMLRYLGKYDGKYQMLKTIDDESSLVYQCSYPCRYFDVLYLDGKDVTEKKKFKNNYGSLLDNALQDADNDLLFRAMINIERKGKTRQKYVRIKNKKMTFLKIPKAKKAVAAKDFEFDYTVHNLECVVNTYYDRAFSALFDGFVGLNKGDKPKYETCVKDTTGIMSKLLAVKKRLPNKGVPKNLRRAFNSLIKNCNDCASDPLKNCKQTGKYLNIQIGNPEGVWGFGTEYFKDCGKYGKQRPIDK